jgi:[ribosomal protein S5]-alanine N-acetyltransferase
MAFLRSVGFFEPDPLIERGPVLLRPPRMSDYESWERLRRESREFLTPWEPTWPADDLTRSAFRCRVKRYVRDMREDSGFALFVFTTMTGELAGGLTLSNLRRGAAQTASLGYWIGLPFARQGLMTAAVRAIIPFGFDNLKLHRIEAACLPTNEPSLRLLRRTGFTEEGFARGYLKINGVWRDHVLFSLLATDPRPS